MSQEELTDGEIRMLTVLGDLSGGRQDVSFTEEQITQHAEKVGVFRMTQEEFERYRRQVVQKIKRYRASTGQA